MADNNKKARRKKGAGNIFKKDNSKYYYLRYKVNGKTKIISLNPATTIKAAETEAKKYLPNIQAKTKEEVSFHVAHARKLLRQEKQIKLDDAWNLYMSSPQRIASDPTDKKNKHKMTAFIKWLEQNYPHIETIQKISENEAQEYAQYLWESGITAKTYNDHIDKVRMVIRLATKIDDSTNPFNQQNLPKKTVESITRNEFTEKEVLRILASFDDDFYLLNKEEMQVLMNIAAWTAQRLKDCCKLQWTSVNFRINSISIVPTKTRRYKKRITIPIHPELKKWLQIAQSWQVDEYVLPKMAERYERNPRGIGSDITKVLQGINGFTVSGKIDAPHRKRKANLYGIHSFRHSFVTFCLNAGIPMAVVESIIGDGSPVIKKHYLHVGHQAVEQAYNALPGSNNNLSLKDKLINKIKFATDEQLQKIEVILE